MNSSPQLLKELLCESRESDNPIATLYRFVRKTSSLYDITGCEEEAISLLINFSVRRDKITNPLDRAEAIEHLAEEQNKLIKRFTNTLKGLHTHNAKFPRSYIKSNIYHRCQYDETDPYVHPGSVNISKQLGYSQNAAFIKASKGLIAEFVFEGRRTSMLEEIQL
ncbi:hypothetical protein, partial [Sansalvadorimonas verongulae]|uniref:hypothetical protein n=1 Tax=Sansalvadorimonas verongulae TaxID=2172824 RepID=UPI0012BCBAB5